MIVYTEYKIHCCNNSDLCTVVGYAATYLKDNNTVRYDIGTYDDYIFIRDWNSNINRTTFDHLLYLLIEKFDSYIFEIEMSMINDNQRKER